MGSISSNIFSRKDDTLISKPNIPNPDENEEDDPVEMAIRATVCNLISSNKRFLCIITNSNSL